MKVYKFKSIYHSPPDPIGYYRVHDENDNIAYFKDGVLLKTIKYIKSETDHWIFQKYHPIEFLLEYPDSTLVFYKNQNKHNEFEASDQYKEIKFYWLNGIVYGSNLSSDSYCNYIPSDDYWAKFCKLQVFS